MTIRPIGIILNGVTGRMGTNQHLVRSILAIRKQGGVRASDDLALLPEPILVGRNEAKLRMLAEQHGDSGNPLTLTTDLDRALADPARSFSSTPRERCNGSSSSSGR